MMSEIPLQSESKVQLRSSEVGAKVYQTPASEWAPPGRIVDDSARGAMFWESTLDETTSPREAAEEHPRSGSEAQEEPLVVSSDGSVPSSAIERLSLNEGEEVKDAAEIPGNNFKIRWLSTRRLPFTRTRDLRNAKNGNKEVKIARDGTEIEPNVGYQLISRFLLPDY